MKRLTLLRHAKSSGKEPDQNDFDRPLNSRGRHDAPLMGRRLAGRGLQPDLLLASPALRSRLTAAAVAKQLAIDAGCLTFDERIYLATVRELLGLVRAIAEDRQNVLLVGHNPGITDLANYLVGGQLENLPTCGLFSVELQVSTWRQLDRAGSRLVFYDYPKRNAE